MRDASSTRKPIDGFPETDSPQICGPSTSSPHRWRAARDATIDRQKRAVAPATVAQGRRVGDLTDLAGETPLSSAHEQRRARTRSVARSRRPVDSPEGPGAMPAGPAETRDGPPSHRAGRAKLRSRRPTPRRRPTRRRSRCRRRRESLALWVRPSFCPPIILMPMLMGAEFMAQDSREINKGRRIAAPQRRRSRSPSGSARRRGTFASSARSDERGRRGRHRSGGRVSAARTGWRR